MYLVQISYIRAIRITFFSENGTRNERPSTTLYVRSEMIGGSLNTWSAVRKNA